MSNEKMKEIKESLQQEIHLTEYVDGVYAENVSLDLLKDVLTLINELESENERLKDEITDSENEKRQLCKAINSIQKGFENGEFVSKDCQTKILKQFAEKLKEKALSHCRTINCYELTFIETTIDELLKEFIND